MTKPMRHCIAVLAALLLCAAPATASRDQVTIMQDDRQILGSGADTRNRTLDEFRALGVDVVKVHMLWDDVAPSGRSKPQGFDGANPDAYPSAAWEPFDQAIAGAQARGMRVLLQLGGRAPEWASRNRVNYPNAAEYGRFVTAVGRRYAGGSGAASSGGGGGGGVPLPGIPRLLDLPVPSQGASAAQAGGSNPRVDLWAFWNEPNLSSWLGPQYRKGVPRSPRIYRALVRAGHQGLVDSGHGNDEILIGDLLPFARSGRTGPKKIRPIQFLRELACVDRRYRPYRGRAARRRGCTRYSALPGTGLAVHPYTLAGGPRVRVPHREDISISTLGRVTSALNRLDRRGRLARRRMPVWVTEFGFQTDPPDRFQAPIRRVPGFMGESEWIAYRNGRVASYSQYTLIDDRLGRGAARYGGWQAGLRFANGRKKRGVYRAFELPLFVRLRGRSSVEVFGAVRNADSGTVTIESRRGRRGSFRRVADATIGARGYFRLSLRVGGASSRYFRFRSGDRTSGALRAARR
jgi:hypothetical protein